MDKIQNVGLMAIKTTIALAFFAAGLSKLAGAEMMVQTFEMIGVGQWLRYLTGLIETGSAILLFVPGMQAIGAGLLLCTMIGAVFAHLTILGPSALPATALGILSAVALFSHRDQFYRT